MLKAKFSGKWQQALQVLFDLLALLTAWHLTVLIRVALNPWMTVELSSQDAYKSAPAFTSILAAWVFAVFVSQLYRSKNEPGAGGNLLRAAEAIAMAGGITIVITFSSRHLNAEISRSFVLLFLPVSFVVLMISRYTAIFAAAFVEHRWSFTQRVALLGEPTEAWGMVQRMKQASQPMDLAGVIVPAETHQAPERALVPVLGTTLEAAEVVNRERLDRVIILKNVPDREVELVGIVFKRMGVTLSHAIQLAGPDTQLQFNSFMGIPLVEMRPIEFGRIETRVKRALDISLSLILLILTLPVLAVIALAIRLTSRGPIFYTSLRVGKGGRHFTFLKFRSMYAHTSREEQCEFHNEKDGHIFKVRHDPRVTPVGRFLRRYSLDELPQLFNVLLGDMSLVGPRPLPAGDLNLDGMSDRYPEWAQCRAQVTPGVSGLWQVRGRSDVSFEEMIRYDIQYVHEWSLRLDLRILFETPLVVLSGRGAW
jgi:exopolysaccharide biosynthesis polyprenyl glycosylphosphotransferase